MVDRQDASDVKKTVMRSPANSSSLCCIALGSILGDSKLAYPQSPAYDASLASYYSAQQEAIRPACIISPRNVEDVSNIVKILIREKLDGPCPFAIRSGGHTSWPGASNIADGVTIDLRYLNSIEIVDAGKTVRIEPAATWDEVYRQLEPLGRSVAGGRVAGVGVGGLTLGGGISFLSPRVGWTADTVQNFQVVLSDGNIVNANDNENSDLFVALRGGSNNFGIVTRIDLRTLEQGPIWTASLVCDTSVRDANIREFVRLSTATTYDEHMSLLLSFSYAGSMGALFIVDTIQYTQAIDNPPVFEGLLKLPTLHRSTGIKTISDTSSDMALTVPKGARSLYRTHTIISNEASVQAIYRAWNESTFKIAAVSDISWTLSLDPIPPAIYARHAAANALGLTDRHGATLLVALLDVRWSNPSEDDLVASTAKEFMNNIQQATSAINAFDRFIYLNYAGPDQAPIASYGEESVEHLRAVRDRVDPAGVFTKQVPGGYKIPS